ncbi:MAG: Maleylpyruvate isomerase, mycothiol-dependent, partial [uncultured Acidimicrobiales bacterium]
GPDPCRGHRHRRPAAEPAARMVGRTRPHPSGPQRRQPRPHARGGGGRRGGRPVSRRQRAAGSRHRGRRRSPGRRARRRRDVDRRPAGSGDGGHARRGLACRAGQGRQRHLATGRSSVPPVAGGRGPPRRPGPALRRLRLARGVRRRGVAPDRRGTSGSAGAGNRRRAAGRGHGRALADPRGSGGRPPFGHRRPTSSPGLAPRSGRRPWLPAPRTLGRL